MGQRHKDAVLALVMIGLVLLVLLIALIERRQYAAVVAAPTEARARILREAVTELRSTCLQGYAANGPLRDYCLDQARFILVLPECGMECRAAANAILPHAHR